MDETSSHRPEARSDDPQSIFKTILSGQPSCVSFVPDRQDLFVIGTYKLDEYPNEGNESNEEGQAQSRSGTVQLFRLENDGHVTHLQTHDLAAPSDLDTQNDRPPGAILDLRFCSLSQYRNYFACCTSTGLILVFQFDVRETPRIQLIRIWAIFEAETILTSLSWDPNPSSQDEADIAIALSNGQVSVVRIPLQDTKLEAEILSTFAHHTESAWISQWCPVTNEGQRRIATGGDDGAIHIVTLNNKKSPSKPETDADVDADSEPEEALHSIDMHALHNRRPTAEHFFDTRTYEAGVTSILPLTNQQSGMLILATGSYDNTIRILETRTITRKWRNLAEYNLGGGVWRLEVLDKRRGVSSSEDTTDRWLVLASCMITGMRVLEIRRSIKQEELDIEVWDIKVLNSFNEHNSICYASAAVCLSQRQEREGETSIWRVISTSFYDRLLCVWEFTWT